MRGRGPGRRRRHGLGLVERAGLGHEQPFVQRPLPSRPPGPRAHALGGEEQVVAAAGVDAVVEQSLAVIVKRDAPDQGVELTAQEVQRVRLRPAREPEGVDQLPVQPAFEQRLGLAHIGHRRGGQVDRDATADEGQRPDPVVLARGVDLEQGRVPLQQRAQRGRGEGGVSRGDSAGGARAAGGVGVLGVLGVAGVAEQIGGGGCIRGMDVAARVGRVLQRCGQARRQAGYRRQTRRGRGGRPQALQCPLDGQTGQGLREDLTRAVLPGADAGGKAQARQRVQTQGAPGRGVVVGHPRGGAQGLPGCGRGVGLHQDLAAIFEVGFGAGAGGRFDPGVAPLQGPGLAVEGGQARAPGLPRRAGNVWFARIVRRARDRAARRTARNATRSNVRSVVRPETSSPRRHRHHGLAQAVQAQIGKARDHDLLCIAGAGGPHRSILCLPLPRALAHPVGALQVRGHRVDGVRVGARAAAQQRQRCGGRCSQPVRTNTPHRAVCTGVGTPPAARRSISSAIASNCRRST